MGTHIKISNGIQQRTEKLFEDIGNTKDELFGAPIYVLTSSDLVLPYQKKLVEALNGKGTFRVSIFTFNRLMWHVYNEIGAGSKVQVSRDTHALLIYRLLRDSYNNVDLDYYTNGKSINESSLQHIAFAYEILEAIEELEDYIVDEDVITYLDRLISCCENETGLHKKLTAIRFIYEQYKEKLNSMSVDGKDEVGVSSINLLRDFVQRLEGSTDQYKNIRAFKGAKIIITGVTSFKPIELKLLSLLHQMGISVQFKDIEYNTDCDVNKLLSLTNGALLLNNSIDNMMQPDLDKLKAKLNCFEAPNNRVEYDVIAHRILNATRMDNDAALSFKDIVVYYRDQKDLLQMIRTFDKYGIPAQYDERKAMTTHPFAQFILGLFEFANIKQSNKHHLDYIETFIKIIKTRYLTHSVLNTYLDRIDDFVHSYAVTYGEMIDEHGNFTPKLLFAKKYSGRRNEDETSTIVDQAMKEFRNQTYDNLVKQRKEYYESFGKDTSEGNMDLEDLNREQDLIDASKVVMTEEGEEQADTTDKPSQTTSFVDTMVVLNHVFNKIQSFISMFNDATQDITNAIHEVNAYLDAHKIYDKLSGQYSFYKDEQKNELQQIYNHFANMIESSLVAFEGTESEANQTRNNDALTVLTDMFQTMFANGYYTTERKIEDAVQIKLLDQASIQHYRFAFIANLDRNNTPKLVKDNKVLSDDIKALADRKLSLSTIERANRDAFLVYLAVQSADKVTLSYSTINHDGRETKESSLLSSITLKLGIQKYSEQYRQYTNRLDGSWIERDTDDKDTSPKLHADKDYELLPPVESMTLPLISQINKLSKLKKEEMSAFDQQWQAAIANVQDNNVSTFNKIEQYYDFYNKPENHSIDHELAHQLYLSQERRESGDGTFIFEPSVSRYQLYNGCAFKHFAQYGLHVQTREPFGIQAKEIGSLQHAVLEALFKEEITNQLQEKTEALVEAESAFSNYLSVNLEGEKIGKLRNKAIKTEEKLEKNREKEANVKNKNTKKYQEILDNIDNQEKELHCLEEKILNYENLEQKCIEKKDDLAHYDEAVFENIIEKLSHYKEKNSKFNHAQFNAYTLRKIARAILNALKFSCMQLSVSHYEPYHFEKDFGYGDKDENHASVDRIETVELSEQLKTYDIYIKGQIDRIDIYKHEVNGKKIAFINVIDYKLSDKTLELKDVLDGGQLQQFSYMYVIMQNKEQFGIGDCVEVLPSTMMFHPVYNELLEVSPNNDSKALLSNGYKQLKPDGMFVNDIPAFNKEYDMNASIALTNLVSNTVYEQDIKKSAELLKKKANLLKECYPVQFAGKDKLNEYINASYAGELNDEKKDTFKLIKDNSQKKFLSNIGFNNVMQHVKEIYKQNTVEIFNGNVAAKPKEDKDGNVNPCTYCEFSSVCYFDVNNTKTKQYDEEAINSKINEVLGGRSE